MNATVSHRLHWRDWGRSVVLHAALVAALAWGVAHSPAPVSPSTRLDMAIQTISAQVRDLEKSLGHQLLKPAGRGVALTEAGQAAFARAEEIFQSGQNIAEEVRQAASGKVTRLTIGLSDGIISMFFTPTLAKIIATLAVALVLVFRPQGLFGARA